LLCGGLANDLDRLVKQLVGVIDFEFHVVSTNSEGSDGSSTNSEEEKKAFKDDKVV
jgi:hypothetical protein